VDLSVLAGEESYATDVNEQEEVVGSRALPGGSSQAVLWDAENRVHEPGTLGGSFSHAHKLNNRGQVIGDAELQVRLLPLQATQSSATDVNSCGDVTGIRVAEGCPQRAFLWQPERPAP
jgi:uncharacterized membrane protein